MFVANYTIVDWGPHGMWLSNCSDDINSTVCDYATEVTQKVTNTMMEHYHDKGLLGWLDDEMAPLHPQIVLNKRIGPEQWDIWKLAASTEELGTWTGYFMGTSCSHSNYSFVIIIHISYKLVFPFLLSQLQEVYNSIRFDIL